LPESMMQIQQDTLDKWGISLDEALTVACDNLRGLSGRAFDSPSPGVWLSPWKDNYDAARLALPGLLRGCQVRGDLAAAVPSRDVLVLTGSEDEAGLRFLADLVEEHMEQPRPLSGVPVRLDGETWLPYVPEQGSALHERFRLLDIKTAGRDYTEQAEVL